MPLLPPVELLMYEPVEEDGIGVLMRDLNTARMSVGDPFDKQST